MSDTCPKIDQNRVRQVRDAIKYMNENQSKDARNLSGNLIGCMSDELKYAMTPLEDLDSANTSIPNNVNDDTVNLLHSIFSQMFQDNNGNSANEPEFVNYVVKMVCAISNHLENHLENSTGNQFKVDPRVIEVKGGAKTRGRSKSRRTNTASSTGVVPPSQSADTTPVDEVPPSQSEVPDPPFESTLAAFYGQRTTTFIQDSSNVIGAYLQATGEHITEKTGELLSTTGSKVRDKVARTTGNMANTTVKFVDEHALQYIRKGKRIVSRNIIDTIDTIQGNIFVIIATNIVLLILAGLFFNIMFEKYYYSYNDTLDILYEELNIINDIIHLTMGGKFTRVLTQLKRLTAIPGLEDCGIYDLNDTDDYFSTVKTFVLGAPVPIETLNCARQAITLKLDQIILDFKRTKYYFGSLLSIVTLLYRSIRKYKTEQIQSAESEKQLSTRDDTINNLQKALDNHHHKDRNTQSLRSRKGSRKGGGKSRRRKVKKQKKKTRKHHKRKTRKSGKKKARKHTTKKR